jgi:hypothetical protein
MEKRDLQQKLEVMTGKLNKKTEEIENMQKQHEQEFILWKQEEKELIEKQKNHKQI